MTFWAYMLHCRGGYFYVGHTDNLELRVGQHQTGDVPGFAAAHRPVELVWSENFQTRDEAKAVEKQLKGWSRAKKMALIRGDRGLVSELAKKKGSPSTSSGTRVGRYAEFPEHGPIIGQRTDFLSSVCSELDEGLPLICHPATPASAVTGVWARLVVGPHRRLVLDFKISCPPISIILPARQTPERRDELWKTTCLELFVGATNRPYYCEYNYSPSGRWAAYRFSAYRTDMMAMDTDAPPMVIVETSETSVSIRIDDEFPTSRYESVRVGLSAVIEETDGTKSYWALRHPPGPPDFHHPDCFALTLPAPDAA